MSGPGSHGPASPPPGPGDEPVTADPAPSRSRALIGALLLAIGVTWLVDTAGWVDVRWQAALPAALIALGVAIIVVSWRGRADGLVGIGVLLTVAVLVAAVAPPRLAASVGDRTEAPTDASALEGEYTHGLGTLTVDLRGVELEAGQRVVASVGIGELLVRLPAAMPVTEVEARVGIGEAWVLGQSRAGLGVRLTERPPPAPGPALSLEASVGIGRLEVTR